MATQEIVQTTDAMENIEGNLFFPGAPAIKCMGYALMHSLQKSFMDAWLQLMSLHMRNCFKDYKIYIHILNRILDLAWKWMNLPLEQQYMLSVLHSQWHACCCSDDFRSQGISRHGIDPQSGNLLSPASEELNLCSVYVHD